MGAFDFRSFARAYATIEASRLQGLEEGRQALLQQQQQELQTGLALLQERRQLQQQGREGLTDYLKLGIGLAEKATPDSAANIYGKGLKAYHGAVTAPGVGEGDLSGLVEQFAPQYRRFMGPGDVPPTGPPPYQGPPVAPAPFFGPAGPSPAPPASAVAGGGPPTAPPGGLPSSLGSAPPVPGGLPTAIGAPPGAGPALNPFQQIQLDALQGAAGVIPGQGGLLAQDLAQAIEERIRATIQQPAPAIAQQGIEPPLSPQTLTQLGFPFAQGFTPSLQELAATGVERPMAATEAPPAPGAAPGAAVEDETDTSFEAPIFGKITLGALSAPERKALRNEIKDLLKRAGDLGPPTDMLDRNDRETLLNQPAKFLDLSTPEKVNLANQWVQAMAKYLTGRSAAQQRIGTQTRTAALKQIGSDLRDLTVATPRMSVFMLPQLLANEDALAQQTKGTPGQYVPRLSAFRQDIQKIQKLLDPTGKTPEQLDKNRALAQNLAAGVKRQFSAGLTPNQVQTTISGLLREFGQSHRRNVTQRRELLRQLEYWFGLVGRPITITKGMLDQMGELDPTTQAFLGMAKDRLHYQGEGLEIQRANFALSAAKHLTEEKTGGAKGAKLPPGATTAIGAAQKNLDAVLKEYTAWRTKRSYLVGALDAADLEGNLPPDFHSPFLQSPEMRQLLQAGIALRSRLREAQEALYSTFDQFGVDINIPESARVGGPPPGAGGAGGGGGKGAPVLAPTGTPGQPGGLPSSGGPAGHPRRTTPGPKPSPVPGRATITETGRGPKSPVQPQIMLDPGVGEAHYKNIEAQAKKQFWAIGKKRNMTEAEIQKAWQRQLPSIRREIGNYRKKREAGQ